MIAALKDNAGAAAVALLMVLFLAFAWLSAKQAQEQTFPQETYNESYVWCESQPDVESCRWGAFNALYSKIAK